MQVEGSVLLVEDDRLLGSAVGYWCDTVTRCETAVHRLSRHAYDLVITDYDLEDGSAEPLLDEIERSGTHVSVLVATGADRERRTAISRHTCVRAVLAKPVTHDQILALVRAHARPRTASHGAAGGGLVVGALERQAILALAAEPV
jgi:DNA-binding response OmpR family regulator